MAHNDLGKLRLSYLQSVLDCTRDALFVTEIDRAAPAGQRVCFVNDAFTQLTGYSLAEAAGQPPTFLCGPDSDFLMVRKLAAAFGRPEKSRLVLLSYRKDGSHYNNEYFVNPLIENDSCKFVVAILQRAADSVSSAAAPDSLETQFQSLADNLSEAVLIHQDKHPLFVNAAYVALFGYASAAEALREISPLMNLPLEQTAQGQLVRCNALRTDGSPIALKLRSHPVDWRGSPATMLTISRDTQTAVRPCLPIQPPSVARPDEAALLRELLDSLPVILAHKTRDLRYSYVNKTYSDWVGRPRDQIVGHHVSNIRNEAHYQLMKQRRENVFAGKVVQYMTNCEFPGRGMCDLLTTLIPQREPDGAINGYFSMAQDITEQKEVERALMRREEQLRLVMDSVPALISYRDRNLCYQYVNKPYSEWYGVRREDMIGCYMTDFIELPIFRLLKPDLDRVLAGERFRRSYDFDHLGRGKRGLIVDYVPHEDENGHVVGFFALGQEPRAQETGGAGERQAAKNSPSAERIARPAGAPPAGK